MKYHQLKSSNSSTQYPYRQLDRKLIVTAEEATVIGGLGSAVAEYTALKKDRPPQLMIGIEDCFPHAGSYPYLLEQCGLTGRQIAERISTVLQGL